jgi:hypothetical protein
MDDRPQMSAWVAALVDAAPCPEGRAGAQPNGASAGTPCPNDPHEEGRSRS